MSKVRFVGMDVHKESVVIAVADGYHDPAVVWGTIENSRGAVIKTLLKLAQGCSVFVVCYDELRIVAEPPESFARSMT